MYVRRSRGAPPRERPLWTCLTCVPFLSLEARRDLPRVTQTTRRGSPRAPRRSPPACRDHPAYRRAESHPRCGTPDAPPSCPSQGVIPLLRPEGGIIRDQQHHRRLEPVQVVVPGPRQALPIPQEGLGIVRRPRQWRAFTRCGSFRGHRTVPPPSQSGRGALGRWRRPPPWPPACQRSGR